MAGAGISLFTSASAANGKPCVMSGLIPIPDYASSADSDLFCKTWLNFTPDPNYQEYVL